MKLALTRHLNEQCCCGTSYGSLEAIVKQLAGSQKDIQVLEAVKLVMSIPERLELRDRALKVLAFVEQAPTRKRKLNRVPANKMNWAGRRCLPKRTRSGESVVGIASMCHC